MRTTRWFGTLAVTLALATPALANDGPTPRDFELLVEGPDVRVRVALANQGEPRAVDVIRELDGDEMNLGELAWSETGALETWVECHPDGTDCELEPELCNDCDDDGVAECPGWCDHWGTFELLDECVPVAEGETATFTYRLANDQYYFSEEQTAEVAQEDPCQFEVIGDDDDDDTAPTGGCSLGRAGDASQLPTRLSFAMALIGAVALTLGRSRKQA
ncbi:MAG: hypothetical protein QGH45_12525 [Myxococcota bacterium]|nr:hypothetical protein [Myxococcota bacterium]